MRVKILTKKRGSIYADVNKEKYISISYGQKRETMEIFVAWYRVKDMAFAGSGDTQKEALSDLVRAIDDGHYVIQA